MPTRKRITARSSRGTEVPLTPRDARELYSLAKHYLVVQGPLSLIVVSGFWFGGVRGWTSPTIAIIVCIAASIYALFLVAWMLTARKQLRDLSGQQMKTSRVSDAGGDRLQ